MPSVLIVDDLVSIHEMLEAVIQPTGFATSFATDGEKALVRYKADKYDLVLADIDMKPMDGITLLKELKDDKDRRELQKIFWARRDPTPGTPGVRDATALQADRGRARAARDGGDGPVGVR